MKKYWSFAEKINKILKYRKLSINKIEKKLEVDGTFRKAYKEDREPNEDLIEEFLGKFQIRRGWWDNPVGDLEDDIFEKKGTYVEIPSDTKDPVEENRILKNIIKQMGETNAYLLKRITDLEQGRG